jgi:hypothetical protein
MPNSNEIAFPITATLPPSILREIGRCCTYHALIEWLLSRTTYLLLGLSDVEGRVSVREPRTTDRLDMIVDLLKLKAISIPEINFSELRQLIQEAATKRDSLAHGIWVRDSSGSLRLNLSGGQWTPPGDRGKTKRRVTLEALEFDALVASRYTAAVGAAINEVKVLHDLVSKKVEQSATSPQKCREESQHRDRPRGPRPHKPPSLHKS